MEIISAPKQPLHIYFRDDMDAYITPEIMKNVMKDITAEVLLCKSWSELSTSISKQPASLVFHIDMVRRHGGTISEFMMMLETLIKYSNPKFKPNIGVGIEATTHLSTIKELQKHKILGIVPSAVTIGAEHTNTAIKSMLDGEPYWPKDIIARLPGNEQKQKNKNGHALTGRQQEVFDLIANRGLSNKQIAHEMFISESTVKFHIQNASKKLHSHRRAELVHRASAAGLIT